MAFTVQNDNGTIANANAYITVTEFKTYHDDRGNSYASYTDPQIEQAIIEATDYIDQRFLFVGERISTTQRTKWPRLDAEDNEGVVRSGIPHEVKDSCADYAFVGLSGTLNPNPTIDTYGQQISAKSEKVGPIEEATTYVGGMNTLPRYPAADRRLIMSGLAYMGREVRRV